MKGLFRNKQGSSLLEIVVAIAVLGLMVAPVCSSLVLSFRLNAESEKTLQARLLVESTVERLMAEGIRYEKGEEKDENGEDIYVLVTPDFTPDDDETTLPDGVDVYPNELDEEAVVDKLWYEITVESGDVVVQTIVKAAPAVVDSVSEGGEG